MNENNKWTLSENARRLETTVITALTMSGLPTEAEVLEHAKALQQLPLYKVDATEFEEVIKRLHAALRIDMGLGSVVIDTHIPWLQAKKADIEPFYWSRYQIHLRKNGWGPRVVNALDRVTDEILDLLGDPSGHSGWPRRGLVMGDVQSGKTSNYTGLICKAADAGYKLVILLTGTLESLRRQTQERLDSGFVGLDSSRVVSQNKQRREIGVGLINATRAAGVFTSTLVDFKASTVNQLGFRLKDFNEPVLLVVKKNKRILENLAGWLQTYNAGPNGEIDLPLLLIDDEADNASVNTNPEKATAINSGIRRLLKLFPRSSYVGFTATPFANVFINPDSTEEMLGDDLFPRDFVYALDPPTNYIGAEKIFGEDAENDCIREITDAEDNFPRGHKSYHQVETLPASLVGAIHCFLVCNAVMDLRPDMTKHRSMLINVSHYTAVQNQVRELVDDLVRQMQQDIRNYASLSENEAIRNETIRDLNALFKREYATAGVTWSQVQQALTAATLPIEVRSVNQQSGASSLDYAQYRQNGLRVIAVGGNSLSRGLTLEGLCVSYFYRSSQMYDTLLQMGRWFGYRTGYDDLFRIWITEEAANWYAHITVATVELRKEIKHMQASHLRPIDFGLKVRSHPESLLVTARNKMRHSEEIERLITISEEGVETPRLLLDGDVLRGNFNAVQNLVGQVLAGGYKRSVPPSNPLWTEVDKQLVAEFLKNFVSHPLNLSFQPRDLAEFIEQSTDTALEHWDIVIPGGSREEVTVAADVRVKLRRRKVEVDLERRSILINAEKMRVGSRGDEKEGMTKDQIDLAEEEFWADPDNLGKKSVSDRAYRKYRSRPLLLLHFIEPTPTDAISVPENCRIVAVGLSFPPLKEQSRRVRYRINLVEVRNMLRNDVEVSDDEEDDDAD